MLDGPPFPDALDYLYRWANELFGRSGMAFDGVAPLSYATLWYWALFTGQTPDADEVRALFQLDAIFRHPPPERKPDADTVLDA